MVINAEPKRVFEIFSLISEIPRGSGNTDKISEFCVNFAEKNGLWCFRDGLNNVIIKKPGSKGRESAEPVILQGHLDMVCEKTADSDIDFKRDGLKLRLDGDLLSAEGTTLGADDGIAVAMILALLEDKTAVHPPVEAVFTTDEETGMFGAQGLDTNRLSGKRLINLDSGEEGVLTVGCAGGAKVHLRFPVSRTANADPCFKITVSGLKGGHSGIDINKGRQNADKLAAELLAEMPFNFALVSIGGGFKDNVIPCACECVLAADSDPTDYVNRFCKEHLTDTDDGLKITVRKTEMSAECLSGDSSQKIIEFLNAVPSGVTALSRSIPGFVESSQNLGIVSTDEECVTAVVSVRSSIAKEKQALLRGIAELAEKYGAEMSVHGDYPAWEYRENSPLVGVMTAVFEKKYGRKPTIETVHAGLECGLLSEKIKGFDAVSLGPDMWDIHTVGERLSVSSTKRTYEYLCEVLKEL